MALTEKQQEKVQVCETNWIRRIAGCVERMGNEKLAKRSDPRKWKEKGSEEDRECDGRVVLREI